MKKKKKEYKSQFKIYEVIWRDAIHDCENASVHDKMESATLITVAYLIKEYENGDLLMANEADINDKTWIRHRNLILCENIIEYREI